MRPIVRNTVGGSAAEEQPGFGVGLSRTPFLNRNAKSARGRAVARWCSRGAPNRVAAKIRLQGRVRMTTDREHRNAGRTHHTGGRCLVFPAPAWLLATGHFFKPCEGWANAEGGHPDRRDDDCRRRPRRRIPHRPEWSRVRSGLDHTIGATFRIGKTCGRRADSQKAC